MTEAKQIPMLSRVRAALYEVIDPELAVNISDLGLIYAIFVDDETNDVTVRMTLTTPGCPMSDSIQKGVKFRLSLIEGIGDIAIDLVFDPQWHPGKMSERCKTKLWR